MEQLSHSLQPDTAEVTLVFIGVYLVARPGTLSEQSW